MRRRHTARDLAQVAVFAALIAALGLPGTIVVGATGVPITLQTLGVMLAGSLLGARKGFLAVGVFQLLTLVGLPLLAGGRGGPGVWASPTAGYLVGWLVGVVVIGVLTARHGGSGPVWVGIVINVVGGMLVVYAFGSAWVAIRTGVPLWTAIAGNALFMPGDVAKAVVAAVVSRQVHRAYPGLIRAETPAGTSRPAA